MDIREFTKNKELNNIIHPWESARAIVTYKLLDKHLNKKNNKKIVDIGCGDAKIINSLSKKWEDSYFYGIDTALDSELINNLNIIINNDKIQLSNHTHLLESQQVNADAIILLDILEHIENDVSFLKNTIDSTYISNETLFLITVPAYQSLYVKRDIWLGHYRRYTVKSLSKLAKMNNLEIMKSGYFFSSLLPVRFVQKIFEKKKTSTEYLGINDWNGNKLVASFFKNILILDFHITNTINKLGIKIPGLSSYILCKKQS